MNDPITQTLVAGRAIEALRDVYDPELGIDVVALGLVYGIETDDEHVTVDMTLTTPGCPVSEQLPAEAARALADTFPDLRTEVRLVWDPPWTPDRMQRDLLPHTPRRGAAR